jgi:hypothetical protein
MPGHVAGHTGIPRQRNSCQRKCSLNEGVIRETWVEDIAPATPATKVRLGYSTMPQLAKISEAEIRHKNGTPGGASGNDAPGVVRRFSANRRTHAHSLVFGGAMWTPKRLKDQVRKYFVKSDPVVLRHDLKAVLQFPGGGSDRRRMMISVLESIAQKVPKRRRIRCGSASRRGSFSI